MKATLRITDADSVLNPEENLDIAYSTSKALRFAVNSKKVITVAVKHNIIIPVAALANLVNSQVLKIAVPFPFTLDSALFRVGDKAVTTAAKAATVQTKVSGTNTTGGTVELVSADLTPTGATKALSAITGANTGAAGGTIEIAVSGVTAFAEGNGWFECTVTELSE